MRMALAALVIGSTASDTPEAQVPRMACTRWTSSSFLAASTAALGLVWSSSENTSSLRPAAPPAAFTSSAAKTMLFCMPEPKFAPLPVIGLSAPMRKVAGDWAQAPRLPSSAAVAAEMRS